MATSEKKVQDQSQVFKIVVSNPGKQYTHQLLFTLEKYQYSYQFFTSFWYKPNQFPFTLLATLPAKIKKAAEATFRKRYFEKIPSEKVIALSYFEILREISDKLFGQRFAESMQFRRDRIHDEWVSKKLDTGCDIVIGYEETCLHTFRKAKTLGITTILDLAQIHYKEIESISVQYPVFGSLFHNQTLRKRINVIKEEEIALSDYILCLSDYAKDSLVNNGIKPDKIFVVNPGFSPEKFKRKQQYQSGKKLKLIFTGTMTRRKGLDLLLKVADELSDKVELSLVGPMADAEDLISRVKNVAYYPYVEQNKLNELLQSSDVFVFPSYLDSWAMVVIEAMATGLPVIVSENTGSKQAINADFGFVIPAGDSEKLKEKILYFCNNTSKIEWMGQKAALQARKYTWDQYHQKLNEVITFVRKNGNK